MNKTRGREFRPIVPLIYCNLDPVSLGLHVQLAESMRYTLPDRASPCWRRIRASIAPASAP
jgi:hypothetical protein